MVGNDNVRVTELTKEDASCGCAITTGIWTRLARTTCCPRRSRRPQHRRRGPRVRRIDDGYWGCPGDASRACLCHAGGYLRGRRGVGGDLRAYRAFRCVQRIHARSSRSRWHRPPAAGALCFHAVPIPADNTDEPRPDGIEPMRQPGAPSEPPRTWSCIRPCGNFCTMPSPPR